jgi:chromosome segregation ATPase
MKTREEYIDSLAAELKVWSAEIDLLTAKAEKATEQAKHNIQEEINELRKNHVEASAKIDQLKESGTEVWEVVKESADKIWDDLRDGFKNVAAKLK